VLDRNGPRAAEHERARRVDDRRALDANRGGGLPKGSAQRVSKKLTPIKVEARPSHILLPPRASARQLE